MALRAVSIVNLEGSIRAEFDQRLDEIERNVRAQQQERANSEEEESDRSHEQEDAPPPDSVTHDTNAPENPVANEDADLGRDTSSQSRARSVDITVEYDAFPEVQPSEDGDAISDTLSREIRRLSSGDNRRMTCCEFYRQHWVGHMVTGVLTGCLFILLGIVFLVNGNEFPYYAGITLIVLGLAPCCMAMNRYRYARLYERERRRALQRLGAIRREHRRNARAESRRIYPDLPPAYDNLGYEVSGDDHVVDDVSSRGGSFVLPTYDQCVKKEDETSVKAPSVIEDFVAEGTGSHSEHSINNNNNNNNALNDEPPPPEFTEITIENDQIEIIPDDEVVEIVEAHFNDGTELPSDFSSPSNGSENQTDPETETAA